jgi:hypothetical protein
VSLPTHSFCLLQYGFRSVAPVDTHALTLRKAENTPCLTVCLCFLFFFADGFQIRKSLTRSTTAPSVSASPSRRTSYVAPSGASSANVLPYGDGFERLVGSTGKEWRSIVEQQGH